MGEKGGFYKYVCKVKQQRGQKYNPWYVWDSFDYIQKVSQLNPLIYIIQMISNQETTPGSLYHSRALLYG